MARAHQSTQRGEATSKPERARWAFSVASRGSQAQLCGSETGPASCFTSSVGRLNATAISSSPTQCPATTPEVRGANEDVRVT